MNYYYLDEVVSALSLEVIEGEVVKDYHRYGHFIAQRVVIRGISCWAVMQEWSFSSPDFLIAYSPSRADINALVNFLYSDRWRIREKYLPYRIDNFKSVEEIVARYDELEAVKFLLRCIFP
jgi:hypothetical protein